MYYSISSVFGIDKSPMPFTANNDDEFTEQLTRFIRLRINDCRECNEVRLDRNYSKKFDIDFLTYTDELGMEHTIAVRLKEITMDEYVEMLLD